MTNFRWGRTLTLRPPVEPAMQRRLAEYFDTYYGYPAGITDVRESAVAAMANVESVFEEVACRS